MPKAHPVTLERALKVLVDAEEDAEDVRLAQEALAEQAGRPFIPLDDARRRLGIRSTLVSLA